MLGEPFLAEEARDMGLVNKVLPLADLLPYAQAQAAKLAALPASSMRATKRLMKDNQTATIDAKMAEEAEYFGAMLSAPEGARRLRHSSKSANRISSSFLDLAVGACRSISPVLRRTGFLQRNQ